MTRFFLTIPEPARLILDAVVLGSDGDIVRLEGLDRDNQPIETVGLRPGEKPHEDRRRMLGIATDAEEGALGEGLLEYVRNLEAPQPAGDAGAEPAAGVAVVVEVDRNQLGGGSSTAIR